MYQDFSNGRKTEVDYINGWIADLADREGTEAKNQRIVQNMVHLAEAMRQFKKNNFYRYSTFEIQFEFDLLTNE
ncbi:hypothetical protein AAX21_04785 [Oenococcus oeni]|nr:hypothetical protein AAX21_04785 [Oenococcus oeni]